MSVVRTPQALMLDIESCDRCAGCPGCGLNRQGHGRVVVQVIDAPWAGVPARFRWFKRRWICRTTWNTVWSHIKPCLQAASDDPARFAGVQVLGVDEHVWHHHDRRRRGPREFTGIVDLTRGEDHPTARLLDLVPGRSGTVYKNWLAERGEDFRLFAFEGVGVLGGVRRVVIV